MSIRPTAAQGKFPYKHRTVAEIDRERSERAKRAVETRIAQQIAWCPVEQRDDYRFLSKVLGAVEARRIIEQHGRH